MLQCRENRRKGQPAQDQQVMGKDPLPVFTPRLKEPIRDASSQGHSWMKTTWRAVFEHSVWSTGGEKLDRMNFVQSEERTMYEHGTGARDVDFCSVTVDGSLNDDVLQQRLHGISRQRKELQHMEIELRAQLIARVEIIGMQKNFDAKSKEHATARTTATPEMDKAYQDCADQLKHLDFVQNAAVCTVGILSNVYGYAKENSGPLKKRHAVAWKKKELSAVIEKEGSIVIKEYRRR